MNKNEHLGYLIKSDQFTCVGVLCSEGATPSDPPIGLYGIGGWLEDDITASMRLGALLAAQWGAKHWRLS